MKVMFNPNKVNHQFAVYEMSVVIEGFWETVYIGAARMTELISIPDARRNRWILKYLPRFEECSIEVLHTCDTLADAQTIRTVLLATGPARAANIEAKPARRSTAQPIMCNQTGEEFDSISDAAAVLDIPSTSISNHLAGRYGYATVQGKTFKRIN